MKFIPFGTPKREESLGVLAYLIVSNKQVHSYQMEILEEYLKALKLELANLSINAILDGKEDANALDASLDSLAQESVLIQRDLYYLLHILSFVDNSIDQNERDLIKKVESIINVSKEDLEKLQKKAIEEAKQIWEQKNIVYDKEWILFEHAGFLNKFLNKIKRIVQFLFGKKKNDSQSSNKYKKVIEKCANIAKGDFQIALPAYQTVLANAKESIATLEEQRDMISQDSNTSSEIRAIVNGFIHLLKHNVMNQSKREAMSLAQKERTLSDFTISLIGRTKAGKSTLHAILTNEGYDKIGGGKQRTTRYNRVYQWNLLRLIDTPGIGSAEAAGRSDDEIAETVLGESDLICFVVVDDSILKDVLEFIEKIASLNKPVIILLNHKENIKPDVKFKHYIKNPMAWLNSDGESRLHGHVNRIMKYANDRGFGDLVKVFPVFLLAAQMSNEKEYKKYRKTLWKSSNIEIFIEQLKQWIAIAGPMKRSQTILDETIGVLTKSVDNIEKAQNPIVEQLQKLQDSQKDKIQKLYDIKDETLKEIESILEKEFHDLAYNKALAFAEEVYDEDGELSAYWERYMKRINFMNKLQTEINEEVDRFVSKGQEMVEELFEDFSYSLEITSGVSDMSLSKIIDYKGIGKIAGGALGAVGSILLAVLGTSNPIGWIVGGIGLIVGLVASFFESKAKKRQKKINKIYDNVKASIKDNAPKQIKKIIEKVDDEMIRGIEDIESIFENLILRLNQIISISDNMVEGYKNEIDKLNKAYAWRICQFLTNGEKDISEEIIQKEILSVNRNNKGVIEIQTKEDIRVNNKKIQDIIVEQVKFL